ncbi:energy-coupling factor ABC transporter ATP-binding protein [Lederbergia wuyishanensis]|uniref:Energy-coupling factor transport system ATP-binding protein n=1 Tax=Lederbergia wuyishanensis TaxID=1347903 RepID=A0ABU0CYU1_9BACI|nr:ABC transporter ATP-binding protein [Lederbergia wuyishanensis]MCJ8005959.1 energy-coupling factor ABC transporter ATP-binding protein [Lederbergia wuyishanensis]MDQ0341324.1 energy-coupling factor transport system ATP-binding protein [Lederbergia wuyishanensis]
MNSIIEMKNVSYRYPVADDWIIKNASFAIEKGKFTAVIGNNGSGKTTLCNIIRGFIPHFYKGELEGEVIVDGKNIVDYQLGQLGEKIGYVFQNPFIQVSGVKDTVFDEVAYGLENLGVEENEIIDRVNEVLKLVKIEHLRDKHPMELSGGQRQRVALASIIVMNPDILVIDEPTSQLDPIGTEHVFDIIRLMKEKGKTIILVEHKMDLIAEYADNLIVLNEGEIVLQGPTREVFANPRFGEHNIQYPHVTEVALHLQKNGVKLNYVPIRDEELPESIGWTNIGVGAHD